MTLPKTIVLPILLSSSLLFLTACNDDKNTDTENNSSKSEIIAHVNNEAITKIDLQNAIKKRALEGKNTQPNVVMQEIVNLEILRQEAVKQGVADLPVVKAEIKRQTTAVLANELIKTQFKDMNITDEQLQSEYELQISTIPSSEYKARHILLNTEDEAKKVITLLENGDAFENLAKSKSTGPSGKNGGDLGWFQAQTMVPEFATAVQIMEKGKFSKSPVKTQFGYHVILLEDTKTVPAPSFESVKDKLKTIVLNKMLTEYVTSITEKAKINLVGQEQEIDKK